MDTEIAESASACLVWFLFIVDAALAAPVLLSLSSW
jgi:hypothetical protein